MRLSTYSLSVALGVVLLSPRPVAATSAISSTFKANDEGRTVEPGEGAITYEPKGGHPGGFLQIMDTGPSSYVIFSPAKFKGDLSLFNGGLLSYEVKVFPPTPPLTSVGSGFGRIQLGGGGSNATFDYAPNPPVPSPKFWKQYSVPMTAEAWHTTDANWDTVLSDVTNFHITLGLENIGFDNFQLKSGHRRRAALRLSSNEDLEPDSDVIPEPSSLFLLATGLLGLVGWRRKRASASG